MTFRLEAFVDDRNLAAVMRAMTGLVSDLKVVPVAREHKVGSDSIVLPTVNRGWFSRSSKAVGLLDLFAAYLKSNVEAGAEVSPYTARSFQRSINRSPAGYGYVLKIAVDEGLLQKSGTSPSSTRYIFSGVAS